MASLVFMAGDANLLIYSMLLPTIYKRTSTGKVQEWTIEVSENKFRTIAGQLGGKLVTSEWTICQSKNSGKANATTPEEQALKEANAKRKLKLEGEYKETVSEIDTLSFKEPLLAKDYKEYSDEIIYPVWTQPKLDGVRCIMTKNGPFSRNGKPFLSIPHIYEKLISIVADTGIEFDGELYNHALKDNFDKIISLVRKSKPTKEDLVESRDTVQYWIYDIRDPNNCFESRFKRLSELIGALDKEGVIRICPTKSISSETELSSVYADYLQDGFEGQMIRWSKTGYEFKRSINLLKRKEFIDQEFEILDISEGEGNRSGMAGYMHFEIDGKPFKANMQGNRELYREYLTNKDNYVGKKATIRYQNLTPEGKPRFPVVITVRDYE